MQLEAVSPAPVAELVAKPQAPRLLRLVFSFPVMLSMLLCVLTVLTVRGRFNDPDMWWHLKTGEIIWNTHHIPTVDTFSYTTHNHPYVPHEWLAQLTIYAAYHFGGYSGMMLWLCILASVLVIASYALCSLYSGNAKVAFLGGMLAWLFSTVALSIRPQMIGYVLLACELLILHLGKTRSSRWFLALPPLFALWVNCHGSFFLGLVIGAVLLGCSLQEFRMGLLVSEPWSNSKRTLLAVALALSTAALFINPVGWRQVVYPLDTMFQQGLQKQMISEWQPLSVNDPRGIALFAVAALILLVPLLRYRCLFLSELLFLAIGAFSPLQHCRMVIVFGMLATPILSRLLGDAWETYEFHRDRIFPNAVVGVITLIAIAVAFPTETMLGRQVQKGNPTKAVEFLKRSGISGNMLNEYGYGGYLIWAAPERKVFVDGRGDVFEWTGVLGDYKKWQNLEVSPQELLDKYRISVCLLPRSVPLARVVPMMRGWKTVYSDSSAIVVVRPHS